MEYVDLGLPSGKKRAKCNLGATSEEESGLFFQWGDIEGYTKGQAGIDKFFNDKTHKYLAFQTDSPKHLIKYNGDDNKTMLDLEDDAAYKILGEHWRIPTKEDALELMEHTTQVLTTINGVNGFKFINKTTPENYIFIPFVGDCYDDWHYDNGCNFCLWLSTIQVGYINTDAFLGYTGGLFTNTLPCYMGYNIRSIYNE